MCAYTGWIFPTRRLKGNMRVWRVGEMAAHKRLRQIHSRQRKIRNFSDSQNILQRPKLGVCLSGDTVTECLWSQRSVKGKTLLTGDQKNTHFKMEMLSWKVNAFCRDVQLCVSVRVCVCVGVCVGVCVRVCVCVCVCVWLFTDRLLGVFPLSDLSDHTHTNKTHTRRLFHWAEFSVVIVAFSHRLLLCVTAVLHMWVLTNYDSRVLSFTRRCWPAMKAFIISFNQICCITTCCTGTCNLLSNND